jgi:hypothetical protein
MSGFDPGDWLARFVAAGGWYVDSDRVIFGWHAHTDEQMATAREVWREIEADQYRRGCVVIHVRLQRPLTLSVAR